MNFLPDFGTACIWTALIAVIIAICAYIVGQAKMRPSDERRNAMQKLGRVAYCVAVLGVIGAAACLSTLLMTHRFDINYVYRYSARGLPSFYLFATFWAGQEGSFLLWAFWTSILGVILAFTAGRKIEGRVMPIYGVILGFLMAILIVKSPFWSYVPMSPTDPQGIPLDGKGLNPLLENYWMVIHPPTLFLGFSSLAVTFSFAAAALIWKDFDNWFRRTWPWALFSFAVLGFGVMLGGFWAYETLGWGGFWGWDPVENGPLVAWLCMVAFIHSTQAQRVRGSLKKTTLFLGLAPFVMALYETFLTRTGILDKFSNHSFSTLGGIADSVILYGLLTAAVCSVGLLIWRSKKIKNQSGAMDDASSRDFGLTISIVLLLACAVIIGIGISAPLITQAGVTLHIIQNQSSVQSGFYNKALFPIGCLLLLGMGLGPYLAWRQTKSSALEPLMWVYMIAVSAAVLFFIASRFLLHDNTTIPLLIMFTLCVFSIIANARLLRIVRGRDLKTVTAGMRTAGGAIAHIGVALLLLGVVCLVGWYRQDDQVLVQGHPRQIDSFPMTVTYAGMTSKLTDPANKLKIDVLEGNSSRQVHYVALMPCAVRDVEDQMKLLARPAIVHRWWGDLYFALKDGPEQVSPTPLIRTSIQVGQTKDVGGFKILYSGFDIPPDVAAEARSGMMPAVFPLTAHLVVTSSSGETKNVDVRYIRYRDNPIGDSSPEVKLPLGKDVFPWAIACTGVDADNATAQFYIRDAGIAPVTAYTVEVSTRPMIGLVWIGTILIALGGLLSSRRRALENRLNPVPDPDSGADGANPKGRGPKEVAGAR